MAVLTSLATLICLPLSTTGIATQERDRLIERLLTPNEPVKITAVKTRHGAIELGKKFRGDEDWFKGLTVRVTNNSSQIITYISVRLTFPRPKDEETAQEPALVDTIEYGFSPFADKQSLPSSLAPPRPVSPGETITLSLSDYWYDRYKRILPKIKYPASIERIEILIENVGFNDGTVWTLGTRYRRDPNNPDNWIPLGESQGKARASPAKYLGRP